MGYTRGRDVRLVGPIRSPARNKRLGVTLDLSTRFKLKLRSTDDAPEGDSNSLIAQQAVAKGVLAIPGSSFFPNDRKSAYVRASFSLSTAEEIDEGLRRLAEVVKEYNAERN